MPAPLPFGSGGKRGCRDSDTMAKVYAVARPSDNGLAGIGGREALE